MQALQAAPPGGGLRLDGDPPDLFWEGQQAQTDLDGFLCSLLTEGQVELTAGLVPQALAARWVLVRGGRAGGRAGACVPAAARGTLHAQPPTAGVRHPPTPNPHPRASFPAVSA